jgi:Meckelin (Transmembrane protein 67)
VKRAFLIDTVSGRIMSSGGKKGDDEELKFYEQYSQITYVKSIEMRFHLNDDDDVDESSDEYNKIGIPLLVMEYGTLNLTHIAKSLNADDESRLYNIDFSFKIKFTKRPNLNFFFQIILPIFILVAFFYSIMCTFFYKMSQQKVEYDLAILLNFAVNLMANVSNAFFIFILIFLLYVYFVYKTQSTVVKIMLPLEREEGLIEILLIFAIIFKVRV